MNTGACTEGLSTATEAVEMEVLDATVEFIPGPDVFFMRTIDDDVDGTADAAVAWNAFAAKLTASISELNGFGA